MTGSMQQFWFTVLEMGDEKVSMSFVLFVQKYLQNLQICIKFDGRADTH